MNGRLGRLLWLLVVATGLGGVALGASVFVEAWQASRAWAGSDAAQHAALPAESPVWLEADPSAPAGAAHGGSAPAGEAHGGSAPAGEASRSTAGRPAPRDPAPDAAPTQVGRPSTGTSVSAPPTPPAVTPTATTLEPDQAGPAASRSGGAAARATVPDEPPAAAGATSEQPPPARESPTAPPMPATARPDEVEVADVDFRFLAPPEPGAHARLAVTVANRSEAPAGPLGLVLANRWLREFDVLGAVPAVLDDRAEGEHERRFEFPAVPPGERRTFELHLLSAGEEVDAPEVRLALADGAEVGRARPRTVAPRPRPGPARAVAIPKLGVRASVVPVPWEPPAFVVGQVRGSAAVSEGNTVLIGHFGGPLGDVFARLSALRPGDEVVATSRGLDYRFVVSEIAVRPFDDLAPTEPTATPRLTLMTCTGQWSVLRQDYSHRLWVVAEPPELARLTIQANAERAAQAAREAEAAAAERAAHEAEAEVQAAPVQAVEGAASSDRRRPASARPATSEGRADAAPDSADAAPGPDADPVAGAASPAPRDSEPALVPGFVVDSPTDGARVPREVTVRGRRLPTADARAPVWLVVRATVEGSRWYVLDRPIAPDRDGRWTATLTLGGSPGLRHEIRVGPADAATDAALRRHVAERPGLPLDDLPAGLETGVRLVVEAR